jgi:hypothetical protein
LLFFKYSKFTTSEDLDWYHLQKQIGLWKIFRPGIPTFREGRHLRIFQNVSSVFNSKFLFIKIKGNSRCLNMVLVYPSVMGIFSILSLCNPIFILWKCFCFRLNKFVLLFKCCCCCSCCLFVIENENTNKKNTCNKLKNEKSEV